MSNEYEGVRRVVYGEEGALFVPVCPKGHFVKEDEAVFVNQETGVKRVPNATCKKCGRVEMIFEGFY